MISPKWYSESGSEGRLPVKHHMLVTIFIIEFSKHITPSQLGFSIFKYRPWMMLSLYRLVEINRVQTNAQYPLSMVSASMGLTHLVGSSIATMTSSSFHFSTQFNWNPTLGMYVGFYPFIKLYLIYKVQ